MIYYVEDDDNIRELVVYTLAATGLPAKGFSESASFFSCVETARPSLVLLDVMLPGEDGVAILKRLREKRETAEIPVMMLTAKGMEYDKVQSLELGADDYLVKPFGMAELVARVKALLRRAAPKETQRVLTSGPLFVDPEKHLVTVNGTEAILTHKEFSLLATLMEHPGRVFTREQLLETVWGYDYEGGTRTVDVHVQTLRTKLGAAGRMIGTVRGVGYRFEDAG